MGQTTTTGKVSPLQKEGHVQLTVHRKITSVVPGFRVVSPVDTKDILSASGPVNITLTSSTDKSCAKAISRITTSHLNAPTDGKLLRITTSSRHPSSVPIGRAARLGISIVNAGWSSIGTSEQVDELAFTVASLGRT